MVNHASSLSATHIPEWIRVYIDYKLLKKRLSQAAKEVEEKVKELGVARQAHFDYVQLGLEERTHPDEAVRVSIDELEGWGAFVRALCDEIGEASEFYRQQVRAVTSEFLMLVKVCIGEQLPAGPPTHPTHPKDHPPTTHRRDPLPHATPCRPTTSPPFPHPTNRSPPSPP